MKPVLVVLLIAALVGFFLLGRCSQPEPVKEPIPREQPVPSGQPPGKKEPAVEGKVEPVQAEPGTILDGPPPVPTTGMAGQEEVRFDEQCRDIRLDAQYFVFPFLYPVGSGRTTYVASEQKKSLPRPVDQQPAGKKEPAVEFESGSTLDGPSQVPATAMARQEEVRFDEQCRDIRLDAQSCVSPFLHPAGGDITICVAPEQKKSLSRPVVLLKPSGKKKRIAPPGRSVQEFFPDIFGKDDSQFACDGKLISAVRGTVASLEDRSILYGIGPLSDCSGILHRVLMGVKKRCPEYEYPALECYRNSRDIARWYHERGELVLIENALEQSGIIRPGVVLFYGRKGSVYKNFSVKTLLASRGGIGHVGVVVQVYKDSAGKVAGYELFHGHGRRGKTKASMTKWHKRRPTRAGYPPFGNGRQQLVAAARIAHPVKMGGKVEQVKPVKREEGALGFQEESPAEEKPNQDL